MKNGGNRSFDAGGGDGSGGRGRSEGANLTGGQDNGHVLLIKGGKDWGGGSDCCHASI